MKYSQIPRPVPKRPVAATLLSIVLAAAYPHSATAAATQTADPITCSTAQEETATIATAKLIIEYNSTDGDLGVHDAFDNHGWSELCVYDPKGRQVLALKPQAQLEDLTVGDILRI